MSPLQWDRWIVVSPDGEITMGIFTTYEDARQARKEIGMNFVVRKQTYSIPDPREES